MSNLPEIKITMQGVSPLLCHNGQTADPRNTYAKAMKAVSSKRKKTDADFDELARLEWLAGIYRSADDLVIPDYVIEGAITFLYPDGEVRYEAGDGIVITSSEEHRHKAVVAPGERALLVFFEPN